MNYSLRQIALSFLFLLHILFFKAICLRKRRYKNYERGHDKEKKEQIINSFQFQVLDDLKLALSTLDDKYSFYKCQVAIT